MESTSKLGLVGFLGILVIGIGKFGHSMADKIKPILKARGAEIIKLAEDTKFPNSLLAKADFSFVFADIRNKKDMSATKTLCSALKKYGCVVCLCASSFGLKEYKLMKDDVHTIIKADNEVKKQYPKFIKRFIETIDLPSLVGLDFADVSLLMKKGKLAKISFGKACGKDRVQESIKNALFKLPKRRMNSMFIQITGGQDIRLEEINKIAEFGTNWSTRSSNVIWSAWVGDNLENKIEIFCLTTYGKPVENNKGSL